MNEGLKEFPVVFERCSRLAWPWRGLDWAVLMVLEQGEGWIGILSGLVRIG